MASAANESHATSSASADDENWKYVECAKCREAAVVQDKQDPNTHIIRADFQLTACGHVACEKCLEVSKGEDGSQTCPKCHLPLQDWISILNAQTNPTLNIYFRSVETMLAEIGSALRFQTSNLRDQAAFYKNIANKQSAALKATKKELAELRAMKKNYEALQRENAALKSQLSAGNSTVQLPRTQQAMPVIHQQPQPVAIRNSHTDHHSITEDSVLNNARHSYNDGNERVFHPVQSRQENRSTHPDFQLDGQVTHEHGPTPGKNRSSAPQGVKRKAHEAEADLSVSQFTLRPRVRESDLPANAMSSAHEYDNRTNSKINGTVNEDSGDTSAFLNQFRFQAGQAGPQIGRSASRQSNGQSPREQVYASRRSSSRGSRGSRNDLPSIEEAPFQRDAMRGETVHPSYRPSSSGGLAFSTGQGQEHSRYVYDLRGDMQMRRDSYQPRSEFVQASTLQPGSGFTYQQSSDIDNRPRTFRPLVAKQSDHSTQPLQPPLRQVRDDYISRPVLLQRATANYGGTARPATAQAGSTSQQQYGRPTQQQIVRPSTSQATRPFQPSASRPIRPMAIPGRSSGSNGNGAVFKFQPEIR